MRHCDDQYPWLSEFLCEYVDGTMAPSARAAFEECLRGNAPLQQHVNRLKATRAVLCDYGCDVHAPCNLRDALHARLRSEGLLVDAVPAEVEAAGLRPSSVWRRGPALLVLVCLAATGFFVAPDERDALSPTARASEPEVRPLPVPVVPVRAVADRAPIAHGDSTRRGATQYRPFDVRRTSVAPPHFAATSIALP